MNIFNILNIFKSEKERKDIKRQRDILAKKTQSTRPHPRNNEVFPEENWVKLVVNQKGEDIQLQTYRYKNTDKQQIKGVVIMFHGLYGYLNTGAHVARYLSESGYTVVGFDFRGHGKSGGIKGLIESEQIHISDCKKFIRLVERKYPSEDLFLLGQSWGGQTAFLLGMEDPQKYTGIVMFAPGIHDLKEHAKIEKQICKVIGYFLPEYGLVEQGRAGGASKNPQIMEDALKDDLMYNGKIMPSVVSVLQSSSDKCQSLFPKFENPFLIIQGGVDKWVDPIVVQKIMEQSPSVDKSYLYYDDVWHNIWAEQEIHEMMPKVVNWINSKIDSKP